MVVAILAIPSFLNAGQAAATDSPRPNILLAIADDQSYPHASAYGTQGVRTPGFDRVAAMGCLFHHAIAASPGCSPSRAALLTGRHHWQLEQAGTHASSFPAQYATFPDLLAAHGYTVGFTGKGWGPGNWKIDGRSHNPAGPSFQSRTSPPPGQHMRATDYAGNFADFLKSRSPGQPFCFWYGASEPHRAYEKGIGLRQGKTLDQVSVPSFLPDTPEIRSDLLDYFVEVEWFDHHLERMLALLEAAGELTNTLIVVTADNGMPFPRAKANLYDSGIRVPMAMAWPARFPGSRHCRQPVGFVDVTATILEACGVSHPHAGESALAPSGQSLLSWLLTGREAIAKPRYAFSGRERHSSSRTSNLGYPCRAVRSERFLYIHNYVPNRWPAGDPQKYNNAGILGPMHGGYHDIDACPTFDFLIEHRDHPDWGRYFQWAVAKRPAEELYDVVADPGCLRNLAEEPAHAETRMRMREVLLGELVRTEDPRLGENPNIWETYKRYSPIRTFPGDMVSAELPD